MRIRIPFLIAFVILLLLASSAGLLPHSVLPSAPEAARPYIPPNGDKVLHFFTFFGLTALFYFILDTTRRRVIHITLIVCTVVLGAGSEVAQGLLPNDRAFDPWDVLANVLGSLAALGLAGTYHKRAAERRRRQKYTAVPGEDVELGEGVGVPGGSQGGQESGIADLTSARVRGKSLEEEVENFDENHPDDFDNWDDEDEGGMARMTPATSEATSDEIPVKKVAVD